MPSSIKVSNIQFNDDLYVKSQKVKINGKKFVTPIKSIDMSNLRRDTPLNDNIKGLNELFKTFNATNLEKYVSGEEKEKKIYAPLNTKIRKTQEEETNICFILYESPNLPSGKSIDFMTNISYFYSDAIPLPLLNSFFNENNNFREQFKEYIEFMAACIESINRHNNKPILGVIPYDVPSTFVPFLVDFYHSNDITSFVYDFKGRVYAGNEAKLRELMIHLKSLDLLEDTFLYSSNVNPGKLLKGSPVIRATDTLIYNFGFDAIGDNHIRRKYPPELIEKMKQRVGPKSVRLFNSEDYGYYKTTDLDLLNSMYPQQETSIPFETFEVDNAKAKQCQKLFNSERIGLETVKYQELISENTEVSDYLKTKSVLRDQDLKVLTDFKKDIKV